MAQSFNMTSVSLGEAERQKDGQDWTDADYQEHQKYYHIDPTMSRLNTTLISANGLNERDLVNEYFGEKMLEMNQAKLDKVKSWNDEHFGQINPKTGKPYKKKSVDKRQMFPVGEYAGKGKRSLPYQTFMGQIAKGNARAKEKNRARTTVLQQAIVGLGDSSEWQQDPVRNLLLKCVHMNGKQAQKDGVQLLNDYYFKPFLEQFKKENPSLHIVQAVVHYDETHPHMQFTFLPNIPGQEYGGLGSVGYTTALKHDHPTMPKNDIIGSFYRQQHDHIRDLIANQQPFLKVDGHPQKMRLGARKGSHKSMPVDSRKQLLDDVNRKYEFVSDYKADLDAYQQALDLRKKQQDDRDALADKNESGFKHSLVDSIKMADPDHMLEPKHLTNKSEQPAKVSTDSGYQQHLEQPTNSLVKLAQILIQKLLSKLLLDEKELTKKRRIYELNHESELADAYQQGRDDQQQQLIDDYKVSPDSPYKLAQNKRLRDTIKRNQRITKESSNVSEKPQKHPNKAKDDSKDVATHDDGFEL